MKKFKFRLEKVLQHRKMIQDEKLRAFSLAMRKQREAEEHLAFLEHEFELNRIKDGETFLVEEIHIRGSYNERLKSEIENLKVTILKLEEEVEEARLAYIEATREVEVLVKLKERKQDAHKEMVSKLEDAFIDELVTQRAGFNAHSKE